jgi:hypothetical protein
MDRAYEGNETRQLAIDLGYSPVVPPKRNRIDAWEYNRALYRRRNEVERLFRRLKGFRRIFSRFEKLDLMFRAFLHFASRGIRQVSTASGYGGSVVMWDKSGQHLLSRLRKRALWGNGEQQLAEILSAHADAAQTVEKAVAEGVSAGKNTYTYDAHTYHTKVPPQGIAQVLRKYLPAGGLVLDPFAGSGMTGVAALTTGHDVILNELSPAASFIADRFTSRCDPAALAAAAKAVTESLAGLRKDLYTTQCRTCGKDTELLFTVWSYKVTCSECSKEFVLWDECRVCQSNCVTSVFHHNAATGTRSSPN